MSWFDATGLANIAKTALKEAQKTIDKALDIRDDDDEAENVKQKASGKTCEEDLSSSGGLDGKHVSSESVAGEEEGKELVNASTMPTSNWGSFSGSFFQVENSSNSDKKTLLISTQPQKFSLLLSDENKTTPLVTPETETTVKANKKNDGISEIGITLEKDGSGKLIYGEKGENGSKKCDGDNVERENSAVVSTQIKSGDEMSNAFYEEKVLTRARGRRNSSNRNSYGSNRLSVLSSESEGKKSSDSVEVLGSLSCATSPDTDLPSISASSSMGLPVSSSCTDSVEVIDSLASPSSIEVLVEGTGSGRTTQSSCINSPKDENVVNQNSLALKMVSSPISSLNDVSPESFEVIPDLPEYDEELSIADSYTSASESTGPTVLEPSYQYSYRMTESFTDLSQASSKFRSGDSTPDVTNKLPSANRNSCDILSGSIHEVPDFYESNKNVEIKENLNNGTLNQLNLTPEESSESTAEIQNRAIRLAQGSPTKKLAVKNDTAKTYNPKKDLEEGEGATQGSDRSDTFSAEEISGSVSSYSDTRTIVANDSSCDEIALESSSEDIGNTNISDNRGNASYRISDKLEQGGSHNHSFYVKNLLSEAMGEGPTTRETSPTLSEKSRSDLVKVGSEQTSGHTSGDELETTTSSDIEIISRYSPNGDSSSTTSRHSPAKLLNHSSKSKLSLVTVDILGKASQAKTKGHQREPSEASSFCSEDNSSEVEKLSKRVTELTEILEARESRLNDLRKTNLEMQEKNQELKKEMEQAKIGAAMGLSALQTESEKDLLIKELKEEGEKLSKKELKQATLIKTLRAQEKSQQTVIDSNKSQIQNLTKALEDCRAELLSKKEAEKMLNENVKQMNKKITRQDEEIANLLNEMEKAVVKAEEFKYLLEMKETELVKCKELLAAEDFELQDAKSIAESKTKQLERLKVFQETAEIELEDLRQQLRRTEEMHSERERSYREEKNELMRRLQEAEGRNEELAQSVTKATRPLLRQMEALQATTSHERETWEKQERNLLHKLEEAESNLSSVMYHEKSFKQETLELRTKVANLEEKIQISNQESVTWKYQVNSLSKQLQEAKLNLEREKQGWEKERENFRSKVNESMAEVISLEHQLAAERGNLEAERRKATALQEQLKEKEAHLPNRGDSNSPRSSPTLSFGRMSLSESLSSTVWPQFNEDGFETASVSGRCLNVYDNLRTGNTTSLIESLQAQLKMRDGEISQMQWEMQRRDTERLALTSELSSVTSKLEELENKLIEAEVAEKNLKGVQTNYDALLEMYGEKVEEVEELRLDLQDVKEMYKSQMKGAMVKKKKLFLSRRFLQIRLGKKKLQRKK